MIEGARMQYGIDCKLYKNSASYETPTWGLLDIVSNVKLNCEYGEGDSTNRAGGGVETVEPTLKKISIEFDVKADNASTQFTALRDAFWAKTAMEIACLDGLVATVGSSGIRGWFKVITFNRDESDDNIVVYNVTLKPCQAANPLTKMVISV